MMENYCTKWGALVKPTLLCTTLPVCSYRQKLVSVNQSYMKGCEGQTNGIDIILYIDSENLTFYSI